MEQEDWINQQLLILVHAKTDIMIIIMLIASNVVLLAYIAFGIHHKINSNALIVIPLNIYQE